MAGATWSLTMAVLVVTTSINKCQQLNSLPPKSIAVNNPGELGLVSPQQAAAAAMTLQPNRPPQYPPQFIYNPGLQHHIYRYQYPQHHLQNAAISAQKEKGILARSLTANNYYNSVPQYQPSVTPSYAYLIANNPYQMAGNTIQQLSGQIREGDRFNFNNLYHQGYVPPHLLNKYSATLIPHIKTQTLHKTQHILENPFHHINPQTDIRYGNNGHLYRPKTDKIFTTPVPTTTTTTTTTTTPPPPTFRTFQGKEYIRKRPIKSRLRYGNGSSSTPARKSSNTETKTRRRRPSQTTKSPAKYEPSSVRHSPSLISTKSRPTRKPAVQTQEIYKDINSIDNPKSFTSIRRHTPTPKITRLRHTTSVPYEEEKEIVYSPDNGKDFENEYNIPPQYRGDSQNYLPYSPLQEDYRPRHYHPYYSQQFKTAPILDHYNDYEKSVEQDLQPIYKTFSTTDEGHHPYQLYSQTLRQHEQNNVFEQTRKAKSLEGMSQEYWKNQNSEAIPTPYHDVPPHYRNSFYSPIEHSVPHQNLVPSYVSTTSTQSTTPKQYLKAWPITPPPSYSPNRRKYNRTKIPKIPHKKIHETHNPSLPRERATAYSRHNYYPTHTERPTHSNRQSLRDLSSHQYHAKNYDEKHERIRNYEAAELVGPRDNEENYQIYTSYEEMEDKRKVNTIEKDSLGYSQYDNYEDPTLSGVYFSPLVTIAPPITPTPVAITQTKSSSSINSNEYNNNRENNKNEEKSTKSTKSYFFSTTPPSAIYHAPPPATDRGISPTPQEIKDHFYEEAHQARYSHGDIAVKGLYGAQNEGLYARGKAQINGPQNFGVYGSPNTRLYGSPGRTLMNTHQLQTYRNNGNTANNIVHRPVLSLNSHPHLQGREYNPYENQPVAFKPMRRRFRRRRPLWMRLGLPGESARDSLLRVQPPIYGYQGTPQIYNPSIINPLKHAGIHVGNKYGKNLIDHSPTIMNPLTQSAIHEYGKYFIDNRQLGHIDKYDKIEFPNYSFNDKFSAVPREIIKPSYLQFNSDFSDQIESGEQSRKATSTTIRPRTASENGILQLRKHQKFLRNSKLQPPDRDVELWKSYSQKTEIISDDQVPITRDIGDPHNSENGELYWENLENKPQYEERINMNENQHIEKRPIQVSHKQISNERTKTIKRMRKPASKRDPSQGKRRRTTIKPIVTNNSESTGELHQLYAPYIKHLKTWDQNNG